MASVNYRLSSEAPHPAGIIDCKTALGYLKAHAEEYGIDAGKIAVSGDSSGGHYALMLSFSMAVQTVSVRLSSHREFTGK